MLLSRITSEASLERPALRSINKPEKTLLIHYALTA